MKLECQKDKLEKAINLAEHATSKNPTLPILSYVLMEAGSGKIKLKATNLDFGVEIVIPAKIEKEGVVAIKGSVLLGFLNNTGGDNRVLIESSGGNLIIKTKNGEAVVKGVPHEDFPEIPKISGVTGVIIRGSILSSGIRSVAYSASISHIKPELASVVLYGEGKKLVFVSTDSFRLAEKKIPVDLPRETPQTIIPIKNAIELARVAEEFDREDVKLFLGKSQIAIEGGGIYFVSRVVEGSFPDYKQIIPKEWKTEAVALKEDFSRALKTATVFSDSFNQTTVSVLPGKNKLELKTKNSEVGEGDIVIQAAISGEAMDISFNHRYLSDCLASISSDSISLSFSGAGKATLIRGVSDSSFSYIVMPMNR